MLPIVIKLGTAEYKVPVLTISKQRAWREKFFNIATNLEGMLGPTANGDTFKAGLAFVMLRFPEKVAELVFEYAATFCRRMSFSSRRPKSRWRERSAGSWSSRSLLDRRWH
jgi:hypothetical protein